MPKLIAFIALALLVLPAEAGARPRHRALTLGPAGAPPPTVTAPVGNSSDRALYIRNLRDSGYNPKNDFNAQGLMVTDY